MQRDSSPALRPATRPACRPLSIARICATASLSACLGIRTANLGGSPSTPRVPLPFLRRVGLLRLPPCIVVSAVITCEPEESSTTRAPIMASKPVKYSDDFVRLTSS